MSLNIFDACVGIAVLIAVTTGFNSGLLRSLASILAYAAAAPIAVATAPLLAPSAANADVSSIQNSLVLAGIFFAAGLVLGKLLRLAIDTTFGPSAALPDRVAGAFLGAVRIGLIAVTLVLVFDVIIPPDQQPDILVGSTAAALAVVGGPNRPEIAAARSRR